MVVKYFAYIRDYTLEKESVIKNCETVEELLQNLCRKYGDKFEKRIFKDGQLSSEIIILVNGRHIIHCNGIYTKLNDADEISIFPVVAGG